MFRAGVTLLLAVGALSCVGEVFAFGEPFATSSVRLTVTQTKRDAGYADYAGDRKEGHLFLQYSEVEFYDENGNDVKVSGVECAKVANKPFDVTIGTEDVSKACDGVIGDNSIGNKMVAKKGSLDAAFQYVEVEFTFATPIKVMKYKICSANDDRSRDPSSWLLNAKIPDNTTGAGGWFLLDKQVGTDVVPADRNTCSPFISTSYDKEVYKLAIEAAQSSSSTSLQIGEIDWYEEGGDGAAKSEKTPATAIYSGNDKQYTRVYGAEGAANLGANSTEKKWLTQGVITDVIFTFPHNTIMSKAEFFLANDGGDSDPKSWRWYHLNDDLTWYEIASHQNVERTTTTRLQSMGTFAVSERPTCACLKNFGFNI